MEKKVIGPVKPKHGGAAIKHPKKRGEWAEAQFMAKAAGLGLMISKPWGESGSYDFVVESHGRLLKVQVKSTINMRYRSKCIAYGCCVHPTPPRRYVAGELDFLAAYIIPEDMWYIFPGQLIVDTKRTIMVLSPGPPDIRRSPTRRLGTSCVKRSSTHAWRGRPRARKPGP